MREKMQERYHEDPAPRAMRVHLIFTIQEKDDGSLPDKEAVGAWLSDLTADASKHEEGLGWRVIRVEEAAIPG
jgi:hypothetical protein